MNMPSKPSVTDDAPREVALLGGGCFWCLDAVFRELQA